MTQNTFAKAKTRDAEDADAPEIFNLISAAARHGLVLPRSISEIQTAIKGFIVAFNSETNETIGCVALRDYGDGLVEDDAGEAREHLPLLVRKQRRARDLLEVSGDR